MKARIKDYLERGIRLVDLMEKLHTTGSRLDNAPDAPYYWTGVLDTIEFLEHHLATVEALESRPQKRLPEICGLVERIEALLPEQEEKNKDEPEKSDLPPM